MIGGGAKLYLAAILDLYSTPIVGWAPGAVNDRHLALRTRLAALGIACSMSRRGNCYSVVSSWFSTVKSEERERFESHAHAKQALVDYIEVFYN